MSVAQQKAWIEERVKLFEENKALLEDLDKNKRTITGDEQAKVDQRNARINELRASLDLAQQTEAEERALAETRGRRTDTRVGDDVDVPTEEERDLAFRAWALGRQASPDMRAAAARLGVDPGAPYIDMAVRMVRREGKAVRTVVPVRTNGQGDILQVLGEARHQSPETRTLVVATATQGGSSVPNEMMQQYTEFQKWFGRIVELSQVVQTETGATLPWPTVTDTSNTAEVLAEATAATTTADPTFGVVNLGAFKISSKAVLISWELLQDSFVDLAGYMGTALGRRIGRFKNNKYTVGAGTTEPKGIVTGGSVGKTAAATNAFTSDEIIDLIHSLDPAYRAMPDSALQAHDTVQAYMRKFKDSQGRYLWEPSLQLGQPDRLYGIPLFTNNDMSSSFATAERLVLFANAKWGFVVRQAGATRFVRDESIYVKEHLVYFEAVERGDSNVVDSTAVKYLRLA